MNDAQRKQLAQALVVTGLILYIPANVLPVMTMTVTGDVEALTVFGGVQELWDSELHSIAAIVFLASIVVPFAKLACLVWLLLLDGGTTLQRERTTVHRIIHLVGSWSMIDIFLLSILTAVGQLGILASVVAEPGCLFFAGVLLCSLFATDFYKPRMIWMTPETKTA